MSEQMSASVSRVLHINFPSHSGFYRIGSYPHLQFAAQVTPSMLGPTECIHLCRPNVIHTLSSIDLLF